MDDERVITDVNRKIQREHALINGATAMRNSTNNPAVQSQADNQIREARRNIDYLQSTMRELQMRRTMDSLNLAQTTGGSPTQSANANPAAAGSTGYRLPGGAAPSPYGPVGPYATDALVTAGNGYQSALAAGNVDMPDRGPFPPGGPGGSFVSPKGRPNYSRLDLIKYDTPHLGPRIQLMLSQLEFKLSVEKQYKDGIEKIIGSYNMDRDRRIQAETRGRRIESIQKIELLKRALKRYEDLHVDMDSTGDPADDDSINSPSIRKPHTGILSLRILAVSDVNHTTTSRLSRGPETFVIMKVEDELKSRTRATRSDKWTDEVHEIEINKGNEVELTVFDKAGGDHPLPIGMLWIRISDIVEETRRQKIQTEFNNAGWVSADKTMDNSQPSRPDLQFNPPPGQPAAPGGLAGLGALQPQTQPVIIDSWFSLEPVGRIQLAMSFTKTNQLQPSNKPLRLGRQGAIRQKKEDVHELYGHKFVAQQFYNIMRCALCGELLKYAIGMQCADCKYMCHEKCYPLVVTKCISRPNAESDPDEAKLNHRIPHRFEAFSNMGANWCCHCGYILPLGRKNCRKCKDCKLTCHAHCIHLVPDFCGMPMKDANLILEASKTAAKKPRTLRPEGREPGAGRRPPAPSAKPSYVVGSSDSAPPSQTHSDRYSYNNDQPSDLGQVANASSKASTPPVGEALQKRPSEQRPTATRMDSGSTASSDAAKAAAAALAGKSKTQESRPTMGSRTSGYSPSLDRIPQSIPSSQQVPQYNPQAYVQVDQRQYQPPTSALSLSPQQPQATSNQPQLVDSSQAVSTSGPSSASTFVERKHEPMSAQAKGSGRRIGLDHFNFLAVLGKGNFGKVMLAETKASKQLYAIKVLKKEFIIENDEVESTKSERDVYIIANKARHPFLLNLHACFQTETRVYFVMEYISGGDLMLHIQRGQFGTKRAQFYAAEVCLALKYFHENGVVYRDLKLDNILLTLDGHIKVADYGLCKKDMYYGSTTSTFCGTPEFMAPEILLDKKYGRAVDWWAFGVLIYQMLLQQSPFRGEDEDEIYDAILADEPLYPIHMPRDSVSILQKLLTREPELRLGSGPTDAQEIMSHAFFRNINWQDIHDKKVAAPYLPQIKSPTDTSNFDSEFTSVTPVLTPVQSVLSQAMQEEFRGFSYSADFV